MAGVSNKEAVTLHRSSMQLVAILDGEGHQCLAWNNNHHYNNSRQEDL